MAGNTTHGSGWMVQAQPTKRAARPLLFLLSFSPLAPRGREGVGKRGSLGAPLCRLGLNHPPTAVGGIPGVFTVSDEVAMPAGTGRAAFEVSLC